jgi:DNA uptake protein ComE-like DNA-binding protein
MHILLAEAIGWLDTEGSRLLHARRLSEDHPKHQAMRALFERPEITFFLRLGDALRTALKQDTPLVFVTDWTDPTEMVGLALEDDSGITTYPDLGFLAFYTDWDDLEQSGIQRIFSHEFSHLWLHALGLDLTNTPSVHFHTITAMTDAFLAFSEGFAEHLEIVAEELQGVPHNEALYDQGLDVESWLSYRDAALRVHAVKNNRFLYHTADVSCDEAMSYADFHQLHITSSAWMPERIKSGTQLLASEGFLASWFHLFRTDQAFAAPCPSDILASFGCEDQTDPLFHRYLKMFAAFLQMDWTKETLLVDFVRIYGELFPSEQEALYDLFLKTTRLSTVDHDLSHLFEQLYVIGRLGDPERFKDHLLLVRQTTNETLEAVLKDPALLAQAIQPSIWMTTDKTIRPVPWSSEEVLHRINLNTATPVDFMALSDIDIAMANHLVEERDRRNGFETLDAFESTLAQLKQRCHTT